MQPTWLDYLTAFGTAGAAVFAGIAVLVAALQGKSSRDLVELERRRDERAREEAHTAQARRIILDQMHVHMVDDEGTVVGADVFLRIHNGSDDPINKVRVRLAFGASRHGPQLIGGIAPGATVSAVAYIPVEGPTAWTPSSIRFVDSQNQSWVLDSEGHLDPDGPDGLERWIEEAQEFARQPHSAEERGVVHGVELIPAWDDWRAELSGTEWEGRENPYLRKVASGTDTAECLSHGGGAAEFKRDSAEVEER